MPQRKKRRPLTTGKGTKSKPIATPGRSPRRVSSKPSEASKVRAAKKTTSSGITRTPSGRRQSEGRSARQATGKARVTSSATRAAGSKARVSYAGEGQTGLRKYYGYAKVTKGRGRSGPKLPKLPSKSTKVTRGGGTGRTAMPKESAARKAARLANRAAKGYRGAGGSTLSRVGGAIGKMASKALVPLAMANEVRTMVQRQKRYNAQKAAMNRRRKKK